MSFERKRDREALSAEMTDELPEVNDLTGVASLTNFSISRIAIKKPREGSRRGTINGEEEPVLSTQRFHVEIGDLSGSPMMDALGSGNIPTNVVPSLTTHEPPGPLYVSNYRRLRLWSRSNVSGVKTTARGEGDLSFVGPIH